MILTTQFNDLVKNSTIAWRKGYEEVPVAARNLYEIVGTDKETSDHSQMDGYGFARRKTQGGSYAKGSPVQGYSLHLAQTRIGLSDDVTWEMRKFDKYREIMRIMQGLGETTAKRLELDLTHMFTFGLQGSSYTNMDGETVSTVAADGVQIFSDSHTITGGTTNIDNYLGTTAISGTGIEAGERLFTAMVNNANQKVTVKPNTIVTSDEPAMLNEVARQMKSDKDPGSAENAINVNKSKYQHIVLPYLNTTNLGAVTTTGKYFWMLADLTHKDAICEVSEYPTFKMATPDSNGEDFDTDNWATKSSAAYSYGVLDFKWIVGSAATSV